MDANCDCRSWPTAALPIPWSWVTASELTCARLSADTASDLSPVSWVGVSAASWVTESPETSSAVSPDISVDVTAASCVALSAPSCAVESWPNPAEVMPPTAPAESAAICVCENDEIWVFRKT